MGKQLNSSQKIERMEDLKNIINEEASQMGKAELVFRQIYSTPTNFTCFEAGFLRMVSWLYMLYYEAGRGELDFAIEKFDIYHADDKNQVRTHYKELRVLRTTFQHSFDLEVARNTNYKKITEAWFNRVIKSNSPSHKSDWQKSFDAITDDALLFLTKIYEVLQSISNDEFKDSIIEDWNYKSSRVHQQHEFDPLIQMVAQEFGMSYFDSNKFRKQNAETWLKEIQNLTGNYDFKTEARKLIERDIFKKPVLPITGIDIMEIFGIQPGQKVKELMQSALKIYTEKPCSKEELIYKIKLEIKS